MSWQPYREREIDIETGSDIDHTPPKRPYHEVFKEFEKMGVNTKMWIKHKNQQDAADRLVEAKTLGIVKGAIKYYLEHKDEQFCPQVRSPYELEMKWDKLVAHKKKYEV